MRSFGCCAFEAAGLEDVYPRGVFKFRSVEEAEAARARHHGL